MRAQNIYNLAATCVVILLGLAISCGANIFLFRWDLWWSCSETCRGDILWLRGHMLHSEYTLWVLWIPPVRLLMVYTWVVSLEWFTPEWFTVRSWHHLITGRDLFIILNWEKRRIRLAFYFWISTGCIEDLWSYATFILLDFNWLEYGLMRDRYCC